MPAYVLLKCVRCSPNQSVSHRVEIIQDPRGWYTRYTCLSCEMVTEEKNIKPGKRTKLDEDVNEDE